MIDPLVKQLLGFEVDVPDNEVMKVWKAASARYCKPCWELKYCPYGPLVEEFPLLPPTRAEAIRHNEYLRSCLQSGTLGDGEPLDDERRAFFEGMLEEQLPEKFPVSIPKPVSDMRCTIFGHICPVVFAGEDATETSEVRRHGRHIPFTTRSKVARRDNSTCQVCGKHLMDSEYEFDHRIPVSRGGSSEEHNVRLTCFECNRRKGSRIDL